MSRYRVMLVDDHTLFREGTRMLLEAHGEFEVVAEASTAAEAIDQVSLCRPDVIAMDIGMADMDGLSATRIIRERCPAVKVLMLTMHGGTEYFFKALEAGAAGYLLKEAAASDLVSAIRAVAEGGVFVYPAVAARLAKGYRAGTDPGSDDPGYAQLTAREREVFRLLAAGHTNREIAVRLHVQSSTVQTHRSHLMQKLQLRSRADLVRRAIELGMLGPMSPAS